MKVMSLRPLRPNAMYSSSLGEGGREGGKGGREGGRGEGGREGGREGGVRRGGREGGEGGREVPQSLKSSNPVGGRQLHILKSTSLFGLSTVQDTCTVSSAKDSQLSNLAKGAKGKSTPGQVVTGTGMFPPCK